MRAIPSVKARTSGRSTQGVLVDEDDRETTLGGGQAHRASVTTKSNQPWRVLKKSTSNSSPRNKEAYPKPP